MAAEECPEPGISPILIILVEERLFPVQVRFIISAGLQERYSLQYRVRHHGSFVHFNLHVPLTARPILLELLRIWQNWLISRLGKMKEYVATSSTTNGLRSGGGPCTGWPISWRIIIQRMFSIPTRTIHPVKDCCLFLQQ